MSFGDETRTGYQRGGLIPAGGIRIETGCVTDQADATFYVPTQFTEVFSVVIDGDGTTHNTTIPDISSGHIKTTLSGSGNGLYINYVAYGF